MDNLYDYFLHFNIYNETWYAIPRSETGQYMNGDVDKSSILNAKKIEDLIKKITSTKK
jgi:hypothetical protein